MRVRFDDTLAGGRDFEHAQVRAADGNFRADAHAATGFHEALPAARGDFLEEEKLDLAIVGEHAGADHARVVQHDAVAGTQVAREVGEALVRNFAGGAVEHEHARCVASLERPRGDQFLGEVKIVVAELVHESIYRRTQRTRRDTGLRVLRDLL